MCNKTSVSSSSEFSRSAVSFRKPLHYAEESNCRTNWDTMLVKWFREAAARWLSNREKLGLLQGEILDGNERKLNILCRFGAYWEPCLESYFIELNPNNETIHSLSCCFKCVCCFFWGIILNNTESVFDMHYWNVVYYDASVDVSERPLTLKTQISCGSE